MKLLKKTWFKILLSMLVGGIFSEIIPIKSGRDSSHLVFPIAVFIFVIFSVFNWVYYFWIYQKNLSSNTDYEDLIDDIE